MVEFWIGAVLIWVCSGFVGGIIGARRNSADAGFILGLLFGPLGAIAAFALDARASCPACHNKLDADVIVCPVCRAQLGWIGGTVLPAQAAEEWTAAIEQRRVALLEKERALNEEYAKQLEDNRKQLEEKRKQFWGFLRKLVPGTCAAIWRPFARADSGLKNISEGSEVLYRVLQIGCFGLLPLTVIAGLTIAVMFTPPTRSREDIPSPQRPKAVDGVPDPAD
jgi:hypothetical protein